MNIRILAWALLAATGLGAPGAVIAQGFSSISSLPASQGAAPQAAAAPAPSVLPAAAPVAAAAPAMAPAVAFSSVSSVPPGGTVPATGAGPSLPVDAGVEMADRIVIEKRLRRLMLFRNGEVVAVYPVRLGLNPQGHKQQEGDFRTPEGSYYLSRRNPRSEFFLSVEVSYPNDADRARAKQSGVRPGGLIMIHGQPNAPRKAPEYYARNDWTDGCIAVSNSDMIDIWRRTRVGIPIEIRP